MVYHQRPSQGYVPIDDRAPRSPATVNAAAGPPRSCAGLPTARWEPALAVGAPTVLQPRLTSAARYIDVLAVVIAAVPLLALGAPMLGYAVGAVAWLAGRVIQATDRSWSRRFSEPRAQVGARLFEAFGRIWLLAAAIIVAGAVGSRADGLTAALVIFGAYTIAFAVKLISGRPAPRADAG